MTLDGLCALPVKKLKGTDPVETVNLSGNLLGVSSAVVIASLIGGNGVLTSLDLSNNALCGVAPYFGPYMLAHMLAHMLVPTLQRASLQSLMPCALMAR